jgi:uncharacterized YigZ family protein
MNYSYKTVVVENKIQLKEKGSNFITFLFPIQSENDFKIRLLELKKEFPSANHHCYAFRLDKSTKLERSSDDGEPSGTAGKPILNQLISSDLNYCAIVVVRIFGGIKLGTSGLIKAYKTAAKTVIESANINFQQEKINYKISFPFELSSEVNKILKNSNSEIINKSADENLHIEIKIPLENLDVMIEKLKNLTKVKFTPDPQ